MILPIYTILIKIERNVIQAAEDLGATPGQVFRKVVLPLSMPGVMSGIIMTFMPAVSTFIISKMLGGGMFMLIGDYIEMQFLGNTYNPGVGSAISLVMMVIILISLFCMRGMDEETKEGILG
jgi:spermidine/putrescine transport system permease protein